MYPKPSNTLKTKDENIIFCPCKKLAGYCPVMYLGRQSRNKNVCSQIRDTMRIKVANNSANSMLSGMRTLDPHIFTCSFATPVQRTLFSKGQTFIRSDHGSCLSERVISHHIFQLINLFVRSVCVYFLPDHLSDHLIFNSQTFYQIRLQIFSYQIN